MYKQAISPWAAAATGIFNDQHLPHIYDRSVGSYTYSVHNAGESLWLLIRWSAGGRIALRMAYGPDSDVRIENVAEQGNQISFYIDTAIGNYTVKLEISDEKTPIFRYTTTLKPKADLYIPYWPRDIVALNKFGNHTPPGGKVHASQFGTRTGFVHFSMERPESGSVYYLQNLTALADYCQATETSAGDTVGGQWPELGFALPTAVKKPLPGGKEYIISDAFIAISEDVPANEFEIARQFLDMLGAIYLHLPRPETEYNDWMDILDKGLNDLENNHGCWSHAGGHDYLNAYVSDYNTPPEIMVQLAVLMPMYEYSIWSETEIPAVKKIIEGLGAFYDNELGTINRWLPAVIDKLDGSEEQLKPYVMDAWYLHHPMLNLARMAEEGGNETTRKLFLDSLDYVIKVAHRFKYRWPVFYDMKTLDIIKGQKQPGKGGEGDVGGLYAIVMLHAWDITKDERYLNEAKKAAKSLIGLGFELFYQANNTALAAKATMRLWNITKDKVFLDISFLCLANIFRNMQLWDCNYGYGKQYSTFFAVYPLADAPYTAAYEEAEVFACLHNYLELAADEDLPESVSILLAEFARYIVQRAAFYYPPRLPKEMLSEKVKMGQVDPGLWIALEDLHDGWEKSGEVGQEVYGAGVAFGIVPRHYLKVPNEEFLIFCDYPTTKFSKKGKTVTFDVRGDSRLNCRMMMVGLNKKDLPGFTVNQKGGETQELKGNPIKGNNIEYTVNGNNTISITWN